MKKVFVDTNVILDYICFRLPGGPLAELLFQQAVAGEIEIFIAAHTMTNIFYILRNESLEIDRRDILKNIAAMCSIVAVDDEMINRALDDERTGDIEDALQLLCAEKCGAVQFVTRDTELKSLIQLFS